MEEKTILRKKFSWKHYPEVRILSTEYFVHATLLSNLCFISQLERFLIAHRDEYLEHSSKNYTAEQKSYNNWLTNQLLALASRNNYIFDPEAFNFVAIRDRIRCYYKSYVQTARKRGLPLPAGKTKKAKPDDNNDNNKDASKQTTSGGSSSSNRGSPIVKVEASEEAVETTVTNDIMDDVSMKDDDQGHHETSTQRTMDDHEERSE